MFKWCFGFFGLFWSIVNRLNQQELKAWAVVVWALWNARNKFYFKKTHLQPRIIFVGATGLLTEYQRLTAAQTTSWGKSVFSFLLAVSYVSGHCVLPASNCWGLKLLCPVSQLVKWCYYLNIIFIFVLKKKKKKNLLVECENKRSNQCDLAYILLTSTRYMALKHGAMTTIANKQTNMLSNVNLNKHKSGYHLR